MIPMRRTIVFTIVIGIVFFTAERFTPTHWLPNEKWLMLSFFFALSVLQHRLTAYGFQDNRSRFVSFYLTMTVLRLILCLLFVGLFLYHKVSNPASFILTFFGLYLFYTSFEVLGLYRNLRRDLKQ
jgi:predicted signal transduction protein with EAL and GGDEF domain